MCSLPPRILPGELERILPCRQGHQYRPLGGGRNYPGSVGIGKFSVQPDGTFDPAAATQVVAVGGTPGMDYYPYAVAVDKAGDIYTVQYATIRATRNALACSGFPPMTLATNGGAPEHMPIGSPAPGDDYCGAHGMAVDPTGTYVAACFWGYHGRRGQYRAATSKS